MPVYPTGLSGGAVVPCSHCNTNERGPEPGICHRNRFDDNSINAACCNKCLRAAHGDNTPNLGSVVDALLSGATGEAGQISCSYCNGRGYLKV
jgi:hypothetical protein